MTRTTAPSLTLRFFMTRDRFDIRIDQTLDLSEPVAIFGPSGSGKTSILRAIAGLERADDGLISLDREVWQDNGNVIPAHKRKAGFVFQNARLFPHLSVDGNLELARRAARAETKLHKSEIVDKLHIGDLLNRNTHSLSGGETQRVAIARTLLAQPRILLMDEPVSSLDSESRHRTIEYIAAITKSFALPLLYVTHDAGEVARLAGSTVLLENGKVTAAGRTPAVFARYDRGSPDSPTASILAATVSETSDALTELTIGDQTLRLPMAGRSTGEPVQLRIFATDVVLAKRRIDDTSIRNILQGTVDSIDAAGRSTAVIRISIENQSLKALITTNSVRELGLSVNDRIYAMIKSVALGDEIQDLQQ
jgi:molybdate transport system ATP-binding protein